MRIFYCLALLSFIPLAAEPKGSTHDAWSDWILDNEVDEEESNEEISENESLEVDQESEYRN